MRIGIVGSGNIGGTLARLLVEAGHEVVLSNSRGPATLAGLVGELGPGATAGTVADAARAGDVVVVAIPFGAHASLPADELAGRIVVDATNYWEARDGGLPRAGGAPGSSSELLSVFLPGARIVKAFNTIHYAHLRAQGTPAGTPGRRAIPLAGDDDAAKAVVAGLIDEIGFDAFDAGTLADGRRIEPGTPVFDVAMTREELAAALRT